MHEAKFLEDRGYTRAELQENVDLLGYLGPAARNHASKGMHFTPVSRQPRRSHLAFPLKDRVNRGVPKLSDEELDEVILRLVVHHSAPWWIAPTCCMKLMASFASWLYALKKTAFLME